MTSTARLLQALEAAGVLVTLNDAGDGLKLKAATPPPAALLDEVRASKPDLLAFLTTPPAPASLPSQVTADPLPAHLRTLVELARVGRLPPGPAKLRSGLVTDLKGHVLAWAECWPRDRTHVLRRLEEAHAATVKP